MTGRGLAVQGALAAAGLVVAYSTWQREPERAAGEVVVVDTTKGDLANVHFEDENSTVDIRRGSDSGESAVWLRVLDKTPLPPAQAETDAGRSPSASPLHPHRLRPHHPPRLPRKPRPARDLRGDEPADKAV